jgi:uncharacterized Fe-S center protein
MPLIGSDFVPVIQERTSYCSQCNEVIPKGATALEAIRDGKCKKRVCSETCRLDFDDAFWRTAAHKRKMRGR